MNADFAKEMQIRRQVEAIYNKTRADFEDLRQWGDYEEEREDIIYNLAQGNDVEAMQSKLAGYQKANSDSILHNQALKAEKQRAQNAVRMASSRVVNINTDLNSEQAGSAAGRNDYQPELALQMQTVMPQAVLASTDSASPARERVTLTACEIGLISGWTPELLYQRGLEEAYASLFVSC